jgi:hypothetical protein
MAVPNPGISMAAPISIEAKNLSPKCIGLRHAVTQVSTTRALFRGPLFRSWRRAD